MCTTVVWEKLVAENGHEKKIVVKNFRLSRLQTIINRSIYAMLTSGSGTDPGRVDGVASHLL